MDLFKAKVARVSPEADGLYDLHLDVRGTDLPSLHTAPGQYVQLSVGEETPAPFAIASAPGSGTFEFLVKEGSPLSRALIRLVPGQSVFCSRPQGQGFPLHEARGHDVLLFATGSGISAIRSTLLALQQDRAQYGQVTLFFGARHPRAFAYLDEHPAWEAARIHIIRVVSQPEQSGWSGLTGYVQGHLAEFGAPEDRVFLCGQPEMVQGVKEQLLKRGVRESNLFLNV